MTTVTFEAQAELAMRWHTLKQEQPKLRIRDAAQNLGVSEAELLATTIDGKKVMRLDNRFRDMVAEMPTLGKVMALTRNESVVHERKGVYQGVDVKGHAGLVVGPDIDLRIFFGEWAVGFAVSETNESGTRHSLQFFDTFGDSVHKVFALEDSAAEAFNRLAANHRSEDQSLIQTVKLTKIRAPEKPDSEIDAAAFRAAWDALQDTHDFFPLLRKFGLSRTQALRLAEASRAQPVSARSARALFDLASSQVLPIMIFVGNAGCIQIHTGTIQNIKVMGPWLNVLDPDFNLHLREDRIATAWVVRKPTKDGVVTSLELFDANGENIALIFGKRKPGQTEDPVWKELIEQMAA